MSYDVDCPYCDEGQEIYHEDGHGYEEGVDHEQQCGHCNKNFTFTTSIHFFYNAEKADCLNGKGHEYEPTKTYPRCFVQMKCNTCEEKREPTDDERKKFEIPTLEQYQSELSSE